MVDISAETFAKNCIHIITQVRKSEKLVLWLRIKDIGREFDVKNIFDLVDKEIKGKFKTSYPTEQQIRKYKRHGSEFVENGTFIYAHECILIPIIIHCRVSIPKSIQFRSKLGFNQYDITLTKEQSVLKSVMDAFEGENMQTQYSVLGCRIDLFFRIRINSDFNIFKVINEKYRHIKKSNKKLTEKLTKKSLIDELSNKLLRLEFKSTNSIKTKCLKYVVKEVLRTL